MINNNNKLLRFKDYSITIKKLQGHFTMSSRVQLSGNEMLNKKVLSSRRKVRNDEAVHRETGRVFHARAAATGNTQDWIAWSPAQSQRRARP